jgi:hypothetical protein
MREHRANGSGISRGFTALLPHSDSQHDRPEHIGDHFMAQARLKAEGSLTLDNASVQRLLDYGLLHYDDNRWVVARTPDAQPSSTDEVERVARALARSDCDPMLMSEIAIGLYVDKRWNEKVAAATAAIAAMVTKP